MTNNQHANAEKIEVQIQGIYFIAGLIKDQCQKLYMQDPQVFLDDMPTTFSVLDLLQTAMDSVSNNLDRYFGPYAAFNEPQLTDIVLETTEAVNRCRAAFIVDEYPVDMLEYRETMLYKLPHVYAGLIGYAEQLKYMLEAGKDRGRISPRSVSRVVFDFYLDAIFEKIKTNTHVFMHGRWWKIEKCEIDPTDRSLFKLHLDFDPLKKVVSSADSLPLIYKAAFKR